MFLQTAYCCKLDDDGAVRCYQMLQAAEQLPCVVCPTDLEVCRSEYDVPGSKLQLACSLACGQHFARKPLQAGCAHAAEAARPTKFVLMAWIVEALSGIHCLAEGVVSITLAAKHGQFSLLLFGLDSIIEVASVLLVFWTLRGWKIGKARERMATGSIGGLLLLLACAAIAASIVHLVRHEEPETAIAGLIIGCISTFDMLCFSAVKTFLARKLHSKVLAADATCSLACASLGLVLVVGSAVYITNPSVWWVDAAAALLLSLLITREGFNALKNACSADFEVGGCC